MDSAPQPPTADTPASRRAFAQLLATLSEVGERFAGDEWSITDPVDTGEALGAIVAHLGTAVELHLDSTPAAPTFRAIVTPWRKALGDNAFAAYHDAPLHPAGRYRVRGNTGGAIYVSFTVEAGPNDGSFPTGTVGVINDEDFEVDAAGNFEFTVGGAGADLVLADDASRLTARHYWEEAEPTARPPAPDLALSIECIGGEAPEPPSSPTDDTIAEAIGRIATYVRSRTLDSIPRPGEGEPPAFVSRIPHEFPEPVNPGDHALAAADASYSMAPYLLGPEEALVMTAAWPECRCANVNLWNRQMQTFDYLRHTVAHNRASVTGVRDDGTFDVVIAHRDPGVDNWLDTEGRPFGLVFWRYMLPTGSIMQPTARVVPFAEVADAVG